MDVLIISGTEMLNVTETKSNSEVSVTDTYNFIVEIANQVKNITAMVYKRFNFFRINNAQISNSITEIDAKVLLCKMLINQNYIKIENNQLRLIID